MKKLFYPVLAASMIFAMHFMGACSKDDSKIPGEIPPPLETEVSVRLSVVVKEMLTRSMDEDSIDDLNIYFFSTKIKLSFLLNPKRAIVRVSDSSRQLYDFYCG